MGPSHDCGLWRQAARDAFALRRMGFTALWLPPAYKGSAGVNDVGYGVYDTYDLGEFDQKGTVRTKYGTRAEYLAAIRMLHLADLQALPDIVLNHRMGADESEEVTVHCDNPDDRSQTDTPEISRRHLHALHLSGARGQIQRFHLDARVLQRGGLERRHAPYGPVPHRRKDLAAGCGQGTRQLRLSHGGGRGYRQPCRAARS